MTLNRSSLLSFAIGCFALLAAPAAPSAALKCLYDASEEHAPFVGLPEGSFETTCVKLRGQEDWIVGQLKQSASADFATLCPAKAFRYGGGNGTGCAPRRDAFGMNFRVRIDNPGNKDMLLIVSDASGTIRAVAPLEPFVVEKDHVKYRLGYRTGFISVIGSDSSLPKVQYYVYLANVHEQQGDTHSFTKFYHVEVFEEGGTCLSHIPNDSSIAPLPCDGNPSGTSYKNKGDEEKDEEQEPKQNSSGGGTEPPPK